MPGKMRPAFGGKALWKVSLNTKSAAAAHILFLQANAGLKQEFEEIRDRIKATGEPLPSQRDRARDMIATYSQGPDVNGLNGTERLLLARLEIDRGLWNMTPTGCSPVAASTTFSRSVVCSGSLRAPVTVLTILRFSDWVGLAQGHSPQRLAATLPSGPQTLYPHQQTRHGSLPRSGENRRPDQTASDTCAHVRLCDRSGRHLHDALRQQGGATPARPPPAALRAIPHDAAAASRRAQPRQVLVGLSIGSSYLPVRAAL